MHAGKNMDIMTTLKKPTVESAHPLPPRRPPPRAHAGVPPPGRDLDALGSAPGLRLAGRGGLGQAPCPWPSAWRSLAASALARLASLLAGDPRHALAWPTRLCRAHRAGGGMRG
jgi:hypothetical protein